MPEGGWRRVAALVLLASALAGCTRVGSTGRTGLHPWTDPNLLRMASTEEPDSLDPLFATTDAANDVLALIAAPVLRYDDRGELIPELARTVPTVANGGISPDGKTIVIHFRPNLHWSDGAPLDARDLRFTWQAAMNPRNDVASRDGWDDIRAVDVPDPLTAVVHLRETYAPVLAIFSIPLLPAHLLARLPDLNHADYNQHPISSGPYVLTAWNHGSSLEFAANPRYWRGPPHIARIVYRVIPNADTLFLALQTHAIDLDLESVGEDEIGRLAHLTGIDTQRRVVANLRTISFNCAKPPLDDIRVRRAIALAVDWNRINATVYHGYNLRAVSDIMPTSWAAPSIAPYPFDRAQAARLLDAAGWHLGADGIRRRAGVPLAVTISSTNAKPANTAAEVQMQQQLRAVGIELTIKNYPTSLLFATDGPLSSGRYDLALTILSAAPDPDNEELWSANFVPPRGSNDTFLRDPTITRLSHQAARVLDRARRKALYQREEARLHALVPAVFLYWQVGYAAYNSDLEHYRPAHYLSSNWNSWEWSL